MLSVGRLVTGKDGNFREGKHQVIATMLGNAGNPNAREVRARFAFQQQQHHQQ
jgi:hypothetical protein